MFGDIGRVGTTGIPYAQSRYTAPRGTGPLWRIMWSKRPSLGKPFVEEVTREMTKVAQVWNTEGRQKTKVCLLHVPFWTVHPDVGELFRNSVPEVSLCVCPGRGWANRSETAAAYKRHHHDTAGI